SARYAPNLERDRNQLIVVTLRASDAATEPFCRRTRGLCYNITMPTMGPRCDSSGVLQEINIARASVPFHSRGCSRRTNKGRRLKRASPSCADRGRALARDRRRAIVRESLLPAPTRFGKLSPRPSATLADFSSRTGFPNHFFCDSWVVGFLEGPTMVRRTSDW